MRIFITGEKGFIGRNLVERMSLFEDLEFVSGSDSNMIYHADCEPCVYQNDISDWVGFLEENKINVVIHNAATVGTDVVAQAV